MNSRDLEKIRAEYQRLFLEYDGSERAKIQMFVFMFEHFEQLLDIAGTGVCD